MRICIQDPSWPDSVYLLEEILAACEGASYGAGFFAFASTGGIKLLLNDDSFVRFLSRSPCELVVGVDAITDNHALDALAICLDEHSRLKARVFIGEANAALFHAKMCWFRHGNKGVCIVGSGNLTGGGLRGNCEAFSVANLNSEHQVALEHTWSSWMNFHARDLLPVDHPTVRKRASLNSGVEPGAGNKPHAVLLEDREGNLSVGAAKTASAAVLIAEIPRSGDRWNQANFDVETFCKFFGATPGKTQRILLTHISHKGIVGPQEVRPSVSVSSHNYRFELEAASGISYPSSGRPIVVFVRVATRTFRYRLLMPGTSEHRLADEYLKSHSSFLANRVRRLTTNVKALSRAKFFAGLGESSSDKV